MDEVTQQKRAPSQETTGASPRPASRLPPVEREGYSAPLRRLQLDSVETVAILVGGLLLALLSVAAHQPATRAETGVFRFFYGLPDALVTVLAVVMQAGSLPVVVVVAAGLLFVWRRRPTVDLIIACTSAWMLAQALKFVVGRPRPSLLGTSFPVRQSITYLGFPSGHVAVAAAAATVLSLWLPRRVRWGAWVVVALVGAGRLAVGAHMPLDVLGGAALGWATGAAVRLVRGSPAGGPAAPALAQALTDAGLPPAEVVQVGDGRRPAFAVRGPEGQQLLAYATGPQQRTADLLFKSWRWLVYTETDDDAPFITPKQQLEHEAYLAQLARDGGVSTHATVATLLVDGSAVLVREYLAGRPLSGLRPEEISDELLTRVWEQVARLRATRLAHRDLRPDNVIVGADGRPSLVNYTFGQSIASAASLARDVAELLVGTSVLVGVERAVHAAHGVLGDQALHEAAPLVQPLALTRPTRRAARRARALLPAVRDRIATVTGAPVRPVQTLTRVRPRTLLGLAAGALAIHLLLPEVGELSETVAAIRDAHFHWLAVGVFWSAATYFFAAVSLLGATARPLPLGETVWAQLATAFTVAFAPSGLGNLALNVRFLERCGLRRPTAVASMGVQAGGGLIVHTCLTLLTAGLATGITVHQFHVPRDWPILLAVVAVLLTLGLLMSFSTRVRRRIVTPTLEAAGHLVRVLRRPKLAASLLGGAAGTGLAYSFCLVACLYAFGAPTPWLSILAVYFVASALGSASPTPGGLGVVEAALVAGLTAVGTPAGPAVAGVLAFRLLTFWLPIAPGYLALRRLQARGLL